jgi:hypothetical protein
MKTLISWILNINVLPWEGHSPESLKKLRAILDKEFEYVDNELSTMGFKNVVKRSQLKIGRSKLKSRFLVGRTKCPINIEPTHWEKLKVYWSKPETKKKVNQMTNV